jgi:hypothetical protein
LAGDDDPEHVTHALDVIGKIHAAVAEFLNHCEMSQRGPHCHTIVTGQAAAHRQANACEYAGAAPTLRRGSR